MELRFTDHLPTLLTITNSLVSTVSECAGFNAPLDTW